MIMMQTMIAMIMMQTGKYLTHLTIKNGICTHTCVHNAALLRPEHWIPGDTGNTGDLGQDADSNDENDVDHVILTVETDTSNDNNDTLDTADTDSHWTLFSRQTRERTQICPATLNFQFLNRKK